ncbi:MAG: hypothetical protein ACOYVF_11435 [Candidatus Zixiibacteriota bacterium]
MKLIRAFEIKWYHILFGLLGLLTIVFVLLWLFIGKSQVNKFTEEKTDMVA